MTYELRAQEAVKKMNYDYMLSKQRENEKVPIHIERCPMCGEELCRVRKDEKDADSWTNKLAIKWIDHFPNCQN